MVRGPISGDLGTPLLPWSLAALRTLIIQEVSGNKAQYILKVFFFSLASSILFNDNPLGPSSFGKLTAAPPQPNHDQKNGAAKVADRSLIKRW